MSDKAQAEQIESALTPIADMKGDIGFCRLGPVATGMRPTAALAMSTMLPKAKLKSRPRCGPGSLGACG